MALAGTLDSIILHENSSSDSYSVVSGQQREGSNNNHSQHVHESLFLEEYQQNNDGAIVSRENAVMLMNQGTTHHQRRFITAFSSGTGLAGIVGYGYKALLSDLFGWDLSRIVWSAMLFALAYWRIYCIGLYNMEKKQSDAAMQLNNSNGELTKQQFHFRDTLESSLLVTGRKCNFDDEFPDNGGSNRVVTRAFKNISSNRLDESNFNQSIKENNEMEDSALELVGHLIIDDPRKNFEVDHFPRTMSSMPIPSQSDSAVTADKLTTNERFKLVLSLWPYTIPLFTVYCAEYMLQAGVWSAIGFPVMSAEARAEFYHYSNWMVSFLSKVPIQDPMHMINLKTLCL